MEIQTEHKTRIKDKLAILLVTALTFGSIAAAPYVVYRRINQDKQREKEYLVRDNSGESLVRSQITSNNEIFKARAETYFKPGAFSTQFVPSDVVTHQKLEFEAINTGTYQLEEIVSIRFRNYKQNSQIKSTTIEVKELPFKTNINLNAQTTSIQVNYSNGPSNNQNKIHLPRYELLK